MAGDGYDVIVAVEGSDFATARARAAELTGGKFVPRESASGSPEGHSRLASRKNAARRKLVRERYGKR